MIISIKMAGIINVCYCLERPELPLKGNYNPDNFRVYFRDTGLLIGSLDEEAQEDLRNNKNFNTYKGAIYKNIGFNDKFYTFPYFTTFLLKKYLKENLYNKL